MFFHFFLYNQVIWKSLCRLANSKKINAFILVLPSSYQLLGNGATNHENVRWSSIDAYRRFIAGLT